jgi:hypothetical protein
VKPKIRLILVQLLSDLGTITLITVIQITQLLGFSGNTMGHRTFVAISYNKDFFKFGNTSFSLFWEGRTQGNYSYVYGGDFNGDGGFSNDLIYIHKNKGEMIFQEFTSSGRTFSAAEQADAWEAFIQQDKYLSANRGKVATRGAAFLPMVYRADFSFAQQLYTNLGGKKILWNSELIF